MQRSTIASALVLTLICVPSCSLIIDTNPDGVRASVGGNGNSKGGGGSSGGGMSSWGGAMDGGNASTTSAGVPNQGTSGGVPNQGNSGSATTSAGGGTSPGAGGFNASGTSGTTNVGLGGAPTTSGGLSGIGGLVVSGGAGASGAATLGGATGSSGATSVGGMGSGTGGASAGGGTWTTGGALETGGKAAGGTSVAIGGAATGGVATGGIATGGAAMGGVATGGAATGGTSTTPCPGTGGPTMVRLPAGFCIDSTEVTRSQYAAWLATTTAATINAQDPTVCGWNTSFAPSSWYAERDARCMPACDNHPQTSVDWCDAVAYCKGVGKRLCGKIGGGSVEQGQEDNPAVSQWYNACSSGGVNIYTYGNTYETKRCNGQEYFGIGSDGYEYTTTVPVASLPGCQANVPYAGIYDLDGNAGEWEDACLPGADSAGMPAINCRVRGGSYSDAESGGMMDCSASNSRGSNAFTRDDIWHSRGFRCCAD